MDTWRNILVKKIRWKKCWSILNSQRSVLYPSLARFIHEVSNCVFSVTLYTTCSQHCFFIHLLIPQMMNRAQKLMHSYLLLNELNELAGENVTIRASRNYLPALLTGEGKNSVKYMKPNQLFSCCCCCFQFSLVLFSGTSRAMENHSTITEQHLVYCYLTNHPKM